MLQALSAHTFPYKQIVLQQQIVIAQIVALHFRHISKQINFNYNKAEAV